MSRAGFQKSVRMFHKFSSETLRRRGGNQGGRDMVQALAALDSILKAEKPFDPALLEPLAAFTSLLQSSQLPPEFGNYSFGDALLAVEDAQAELRQADDQRWEFEPELDDESAATWLAVAEPALPDPGAEHATKLRRFVLEALPTVPPSSALVVGALHAADLPYAELSERFERLTLSDVDLPGLEALVRRAVPEAQRNKVRLERYDVTGTRAAFARDLGRIVAEASSPEAAVTELTTWLQGYDVSAGSAGLSGSEEKPALAISALLLAGLGLDHARAVAAAFTARGWDVAHVGRPPLGPSLTLLRCLLQQHHIQALLRRAQSALLATAVSHVEVRRQPNGQDTASGEPEDLLLVERLSERLPSATAIKAEQSWEVRLPHPSGEPGRGLVALVESVLV